MKSTMERPPLGRHLTLAVFVVAFFAATLDSAQAAPIVFDLTDPTSGAATAGEDLESSGSASQGGVTITATAAGGALNSLSNSFGVNATGSDDSDQIEFDFSESLTFTITFNAPTTVSLTEIDFLGIGPNANDDALVNVAGAGNVTLETGATDFAGTPDTWTPAGGISLSSGDTIVFTPSSHDGASFGLESITFDVVPEPATCISFAIGMFFLGIRRRSFRRAE